MFVHSSRIKKHLDYMRSRGVLKNPTHPFEGIDEEELNDQERTYPLEDFIRVFSSGIRLTGDEYYGLKMGREPHMAGTVGVMSASCRNMKEAFVQGCRYFLVQGDFGEVVFVDDPVHPKVKYTLCPAWLQNDSTSARHEVDAMFSFLANILAINSNHTLKPYAVELVRLPPEDSTCYEEYLGVVPLFSRKENTMVFRAQDLQIPMKAFNPELSRILRGHIEEQIRKFTGEERVSEKVRSILLSSVRYSFPDIEELSGKLNMSSRTLQRLLAREKTSFKNLLQDTRFDLAKRLMQNDKLTISEIAYSLGYSDLANFSRSFKRFTGSSPQSYRIKLINQ